MAADALKSQSIISLDSTPIIPVTAGQGGPGRVVMVDDYCVPTAVGIATTASIYRLCRFPTGAIIKRVYIAQSTELDTYSSGATLVFDFNIAFSDSTDDGTPTWLQGLIPTTANTGATTTFASYTAPNIMFGQKTQVYNALINNDYVFSGSQTNYPMATLLTQPLWQVFGFVDGRGMPADPGGNFDLVAYVSTAAHTGATGTLYARVEYVI